MLKQIQKRGNTLVLIEHHPWIIQNADWIVEMGPGAGEKGGKVLFQGPRDEVLNNPESPTGKWVRELDESPRHPEPRNKSGVKSAKDPDPKSHPAIQVKNFALYDMESVSAQFPVQKFSVITGQSGSGKSTLLFQRALIQ